MTPQEAAALLAVAAAYDNRKPDADAATAWSVALDGYRFHDCRDVIVSHYRSTTDWLMPHHVITGVRKIRDKRIAEAGDLTPPPAPAELDPAPAVAWQIAWLRDAKRRIGDGEVVSVDFGELKERHLPDLRQILPAIPDAARTQLRGDTP